MSMNSDNTGNGQASSASDGFNILGPLRAGTLWAAAVRGLADLISRVGYPVSLRDIPLEGQQGSLDLHIDMHGEMPYACSLFCLDPQQLDRLFSAAPPWLKLKDRLNIGLVPYTGRQPSDAVPFLLGKMDAVGYLSPAAGERFEKLLPGMKHFLFPQACRTRTSEQGSRAGFHLPGESTLIAVYFESGIPLESQCALEIFDAFRKIPGESQCGMVVVLDRTHGSREEDARKIRALWANDSRVMLFEGMIDDDATGALFSCCDIVCGFPRPHGAAPLLMETMLEGRPVVTCMPEGLPFVNDSTAAIVTCDHGNGRCSPETDSLAELFRKLIDDGSERIRLGQTGRAAAEEYVRLRDDTVVNLVYRLNEARSGKRFLLHRRPSRIASLSSQPRVLFQNRPDMFERPGGDTAVLHALRTEFAEMGIRSDISNDPFHSLDEYDIVHTFNTTLSIYTEAFARNAIARGKPLAVTPLQEDFPRYLTRARLWFEILSRYVASGQSETLFDRMTKGISLDRDGPFLSAPLTLGCAGTVLTSGKAEEKCILERFPAARTVIARFGLDTKEEAVSGDLFRSAFNLDRFILCVGRLETRKNQLMLLKALEHENLPLVFVTGGVTYQPAYRECCKRFRRSAPTLFIERLERKMLVSAYKACAAHVLPSWYELPGLVTLEAAALGCRVVASSWGTAGDYIDEEVTWCEPDSVESVRHAVLHALELPAPKALAGKMKDFTWRRTAEAVLESYHRLLETGNNTDPLERAIAAPPQFDSRSPEEVLEKITRLVEEKRFEEALHLYETVGPELTKIPGMRGFDGMMQRVRGRISPSHPAPSPETSRSEPGELP